MKMDLYTKGGKENLRGPGEPEKVKKDVNDLY